MTKGILGRKVGMTQVFEAGRYSGDGNGHRGWAVQGNAGANR